MRSWEVEAFFLACSHEYGEATSQETKLTTYEKQGRIRDLACANKAIYLVLMQVQCHCLCALPARKACLVFHHAVLRLFPGQTLAIRLTIVLPPYCYPSAQFL